MNHPDKIAAWISSAVAAKYVTGQKEYGGILRHKHVLPKMVEEIVDLVVYVAVLQEQVDLVLRLLEMAYKLDSPHDKRYVMAAIDVLVTGNMQGKVEDELTGEPEAVMYTDITRTDNTEDLLEWLS